MGLFIDAVLFVVFGLRFALIVCVVGFVGSFVALQGLFVGALGGFPGFISFVGFVLFCVALCVLLCMGLL